MDYLDPLVDHQWSTMIRFFWESQRDHKCDNSNHSSNPMMQKLKSE